MDIQHLDHPYQIGDAPDEVIIREAKTYHIRGLPSDQVLDLPHISILESGKLTTFVHHRLEYSSSRLVMIKKRQSSWKN